MAGVGHIGEVGLAGDVRPVPGVLPMTLAAAAGGVAEVLVAADAAREAADAATRRYREGRPLSPVDGCPIGVKDIIGTRGMPTQMNSPASSA